MEYEYSNELKGKVFSYRFEQWEKSIIAKSLSPEIKKLYNKIEKIKNDPKNEGQATYICQIDEINTKIKILEFIVAAFSVKMGAGKNMDANY